MSALNAWRVSCVTMLLAVSVCVSTAGQATELCEKRFAQAFTESVKWEILRQIKHELVYVRRQRFVEDLVDRGLRDIVIDDFARGLRSLSARIPTSVLLVDGDGCVWLFSSNGAVFANRAGSWDEFELHRLLSRLGASMDGLVSNRRTRSNAVCEPRATTAASSPKPASDQAVRLMRARNGLLRAREKLIPERLYEELRATKDQRLIVVASGGAGIVPFAALPLGEGYLIDKFAILIAPGTSTLMQVPRLTIDQAGLRLFVRLLQDRLGYGRRDTREREPRLWVRDDTRRRLETLARGDGSVGREAEAWVSMLERLQRQPPDFDLEQSPLVSMLQGLDHILVGFERDQTEVLRRYREFDVEAYSHVSKLSELFVSQLSDLRHSLEKGIAWYNLRVQRDMVRSLTLGVRVETKPKTSRISGISPPPISKQTVVVVGNPDLGWDKEYCWDQLPSAEGEARHVAERFGPTNLLVGRRATYARVVSELKRQASTAKYIYFATHGLSDSVDPADGSFLALSEKHLSGASLRSLSFKNAPLVVLSACQTGLGKTFPGGLFGLAQAWQHAGAQKTLMTLWNINDAATAELMRIFNDRLRVQSSDGIAVERAEQILAEAIREFKGRQSDPVLWAGLSLYGVPSE